MRRTCAQYWGLRLRRPLTEAGTVGATHPDWLRRQLRHPKKSHMAVSTAKMPVATLQKKEPRPTLHHHTRRHTPTQPCTPSTVRISMQLVDIVSERARESHLASAFKIFHLKCGHVANIKGLSSTSSTPPPCSSSPHPRENCELEGRWWCTHHGRPPAP